MSVSAKEIVIHDGNAHLFTIDQIVDGEQKSRGLVPRNYATHPPGYSPRGVPFDMPLIPRSEWSERIRDMEGSKSRLSDLRNTGQNGQQIPSRDQNGRGYCWFHSGTSATLLLRARDHQPYVDLSAYAGACLIKDYRDEGGWGAQGLDWIIENGIPSSEFWPQRSVSRSNDTPAMRENAKLHRVSESWMETGAQYDRNLTYDQVITCLLCRIPVIVDYNWWGHSVCAADAVDGVSQWGGPGGRDEITGKMLSLPEFDRRFGLSDPVTGAVVIRIWNSWSDSWSDSGMGTLSASKSVPDGASAPRVAYASAA